jgi:hypothetical protein
VAAAPGQGAHALPVTLTAARQSRSRTGFPDPNTVEHDWLPEPISLPRQVGTGHSLTRTRRCPVRYDSFPQP